MGVSSHHQAAREGVIFQNRLVNNAGTRLPESKAVALPHAGEEVVDLSVFVIRDAQVAVVALVGTNQVVAVNGGRNCSLVLAGHHELQQRHLCGGILQRDAVRSQQ